MPKKKRTDIEHTKWPVANLRPHPKQEAHFNELPIAMIRALAADIKINELGEPLEILPDGTLISGHQRLRAVRELEWETVSVRVRHDLANQPKKAAEHRLIECNANKRQLTLLEQARCYRLLKESAPPAAKRDSGGDLRDELAKRMGKSGRSLDRLLPLLELPREIQQAVDEKKIPVKTATALAKLPREAQDRVVQAIIQGGNLRMTVFRVLHANGLIGRRDATAEQLKAQLRALLLQGTRLAREANRLRPMVRKDQEDKLRLVADFVLHLCPAGTTIAEQSKGQSKSKNRRTPA